MPILEVLGWALVVLTMGRGWWGAAGGDSSRTRGICSLEGVPWPVVDPGVWVVDGEALWQVRSFLLK